ncbi:isochorismate synthase [Polaribacter sargassicola]|uniref:isochorismate synthase n=1 Tax=Polaribacter sargassicola TaxID=2836891 RepID=UPI0021D45B95|nr:isochorismate synthase [Polaribacter sp. DS7-9]
MNIIFNKIKKSYRSQKPFVVYRKPKEKEVLSFFQEDDTLHFSSDFNEEGFVFSPFNSDEKTVLFPLENSELIKEEIVLDKDFDLKKVDIKKNNIDKEKHVHLIEAALSEINSNKLIKVVVSRKEEVLLSEFDVLLTFKKLLTTYTNAFVYVWFHPKVGLWFGATPETLLNISKKSFNTMSLAGTQVNKNLSKVVWKNKELEEQQLVTNFIENQLTPISTSLKIDKKETVKAGDLLHLRTKVTGSLNDKASLKELIRALHPTPAVCGLPRESAKNFINLKENYKRTFYAGFLGELNLEKQNTSLFVNLRCMSVVDNIASVYVGGGITRESNAEKEWKETVFKSKTIKKVL